MSATYHFERWAFHHDGRCVICDDWTPSGVRAAGRMRFTRLCERCANERFSGAVTLRTSGGKIETRVAK